MIVKSMIFMIYLLVCLQVVCKNCLDERSSKLSDNEKHMCVTCSAKAKRRGSLTRD